MPQLKKNRFLTNFLNFTAETEKIIEDTSDLQPRSFTPQPTTSPMMSQKSKGLRSIFGKLKRSNSGNLEDVPNDGEFKRGGTRSTCPTTTRNVWNEQSYRPDKPFAEWDMETVCCWMAELGLDSYENECRRWLKDGAAELVTAAPADIERELKLKSPLHKKKIILAVADFSERESDEVFKAAGKLDMGWVSFFFK